MTFDGDNPPRDGGDSEGCAVCEAPLLAEIDITEGKVWIICSGGCGRTLYPEIENPGPIERDA